MEDVNSVALTGTVHRITQSRTLDDGSQVSRFEISTVNKSKSSPSTIISIEAFRDIATKVQHLVIGDRVFITGRLRVYRWDTTSRHHFRLGVQAQAIEKIT